MIICHFKTGIVPLVVVKSQLRNFTWVEKSTQSSEAELTAGVWQGSIFCFQRAHRRPGEQLNR